MKARVINKNGRDKKFIGAAIGAVTSIAGGLINRAKQKKAARKQAEANRLSATMQAQEQANQDAVNQSQQYENQEYVDDVKNKISFRNGGKSKVSVAKKYKCGGRSKALFGIGKNKQNNQDAQQTTDNKQQADGQENKMTTMQKIGNYADAAAPAIGNVIGAAMTPVAKATITRPTKNAATFASTKTIKPNSWEQNGTDDTSQYRDRLSMARMGKRCKTRK